MSVRRGAALPRVAIFARAPVLGRVKTRLANSVGADAALSVYERLLVRTLDELAPGRGRFVPEIWLEGPTGAACFADRPVIAQPDGDLGHRMAAAFDAGAAALVGTDIPMLTAGYVDAALDALADADLVLGPVEDGGYCLIAMREPRRALFEGIPWSTPEVLTVTLEAARRLSLSVALLECLWDVDDVADLERWRSALERKPGERPRGARWLPPV